MSSPTSISVKIGKEELIFETGKLAKLSNGAVTVRSGETILLAAADAAPSKEGTDFLPLTVDYRERMYAAGKIPGGFFKREGKPSEREVLTCRLIDRPVRSLFDENYFNDVQLMITVLSADGENPPDVLAMNACAAALAISSIPFTAIMGAVRVSYKDGGFIANPGYTDMQTTSMDIVVAGTATEIVMVECAASEVSEETFIEGLRFAHKNIREVCQAIEKLQKAVGKKKDAIEPREIPAETRKKITDIVGRKFDEMSEPQKKEERTARRQELWEKVKAAFDSEAKDYCEGHLKSIFEELEWESVRKLILDQQKRPDGRGFEEIRALSCEVGLLPRAHGSAVFTRGQTQSLGVATLGAGDDEQKIDALEGAATKYFMLHYNFPAFSVGEVRPNRGVGRREVGHGALAEKALVPVLPPHETFPYTIRMVSDILESNGSSSMASVCSCTLALMDAGVPISAPVAGIAMGLVRGDKNFAVLTDIAGVEDHLGDMDFKVAGTAKGITAVQVDLKIKGLSFEIIEKTLTQARKARLQILDVMNKTLQAPRTEMSVHAPRFTVIEINPEKIKNVIGPGGKVIKEITKQTGVKIDIEDSGKVSVFSTDSAAAERAVEWIRSLTASAEVGKIYQGKVKRLMNFGAFCEILPGMEGLVHVSELADQYVAHVEDVVKVGDEFPVVVVEIDDQGRVNLSAKQAGANLVVKESTGGDGERSHDRPSHGRPPRSGGRDNFRGRGGPRR